MRLPASSPFVKESRSVAQIMRYVLLALIPAVLLHVAFMGFGILIQFALAAFVGVALEIAILRLRRKPWRDGINRGSEDGRIGDGCCLIQRGRRALGRQ